MKKNKLQQLSDLWSRATEQAVEERPRAHELGDHALHRTAAFPVKSSVKAGAEIGSGGISPSVQYQCD